MFIKSQTLPRRHIFGKRLLSIQFAHFKGVIGTCLTDPWSIFWGTLEKLYSLSMNSLRLDRWTLDAWARDDWILDDGTVDYWTYGLWTFGPRKFFPFLVTSISLFLFYVEFWNILLYDWFVIALLNVLRMVIIIRSCYHWHYNSNSLARQQLGLKLNFSWTGMQIIVSEIIQIDGKIFPKKPWIRPWKRSIELRADLIKQDPRKKF